MSERRILPLCALLLFGAFLSAQPAPQEEDPYEKMTFKMAVFGPSDEIFIWWGHAALIVENTPGGYARIFDWGIFSYPSDSFLKDFALNRVRYKCGVSSAQWDIDSYIKEDRDIMLYTLNIDSSGKAAILQYAENNVLPENCWYIYHQFRDNCSTRIRDLINMGTSGRLKRHFEAQPGHFTLREHMRRFTWYSPFFDWFLGFLLGRDIDKKISMWEEMYLPVELGRDILAFSYTDTAGRERGLVSAVEIINRTQNRKSILNAPRPQWPRALAVGLAIAAAVTLIVPFRKKHPLAGRTLWGLAQSFFGLVFGFAGTILFAASRIAERDYMRHNINLLFINPLLLAAIPMGIYAALGKKIHVGKFSASPEKCLCVLWLYVCISGIVTGVLEFIPLLYQQNQFILALLLPPALAFVLPGFQLYCIEKTSCAGGIRLRRGVS